MRTPLLGSTPPKLHQHQKRDRHGFRGTPPPVSFSLRDLPDDAQLTEYEVAAIGRWSTNTVAAWRRQPDHPLTWRLVAGRHVRYRVGDLKSYMAAPAKKPRVPAQHHARAAPHASPTTAGES
jgi:hypothetical protein